eukprot:2914842-Rhodomonas_salina.1
MLQQQAIRGADLDESGERVDLVDVHRPQVPRVPAQRVDRLPRQMAPERHLHEHRHRIIPLLRLFCPLQMSLICPLRRARSTAPGCVRCRRRCAAPDSPGLRRKRGDARVETVLRAPEVHGLVARARRAR